MNKLLNLKNNKEFAIIEFDQPDSKANVLFAAVMGKRERGQPLKCEMI